MDSGILLNSRDFEVVTIQTRPAAHENSLAHSVSQARCRETRKDCSMPNTFDWIEIKTNDIDASAHFYESLFGWRITKRETADRFAVWLFDTGGEPRVWNLRRGGMWLRPSDEALGVVVDNRQLHRA